MPLGAGAGAGLLRLGAGLNRGAGAEDYATADSGAGERPGPGRGRGGRGRGTQRQTAAGGNAALLARIAALETALALSLNTIAAKLGDYVYAIDGLGQASGDLVCTINQLMTEGKHTLAVVETASQGLLAAKCIGLEWLLETHYQQALERLGQKLNVTLDSNDLSASARAVATAIRRDSAADFVLVQLAAGDNKIFHAKDQAILLYNVLLTEDGFYQTTHSVAGPISTKQNQAALLALDLLRRYLQHKEL